MDSLTASLAFATVVQLLCNYRQEKGTRKQAELDDFLSWLTHHRFEQIKDQIQNSANLQLGIQSLLREDVGTINQKLDIISQSITSLGSRIQGLSGIASAIGASSNSISDQAITILDMFEKSGDVQFVIFGSSNPARCRLLPSGRSIQGIDGRFVRDDITTLEAMGFIICVDYNSKGDPIYSLTRNGANFAQSTRKNTPGEQEVETSKEDQP